jgi:type I restriction enzyme, R subunit
VSNFGFLQAEWPELHGEAMRAERLAIADPRTSCFYARRAVELTLNWLYQADDTLREPYRRDLSAMINEPTLVNLVGPALRMKMDVIRRQGNLAVHSTRPVANIQLPLSARIDRGAGLADGVDLITEGSGIEML